MTVLLDGFNVAKTIRSQIKTETDDLRNKGNRIPCLAVMIVGNDPASQTYVASKARQCAEVGFNSKVIELPEETNEQDIITAVHELNEDSRVDGILVQLPLPSHVDPNRVIEAIDPKKDVDGLHPINLGLLEIGQPQFIPCTPKGIMTLLDHYDISLEGKRALVIGRSRLVGKPVASLLLAKNATVTIAHSRTNNINQLIKENDIIVVAVGVKEFVKVEQLNPNHILVDVGIHREEGKLYGDVEKAAYSYVKYATPVPKGVGPMTIASLLENTMQAYKAKEEMQ